VIWDILGAPIVEKYCSTGCFSFDVTLHGISPEIATCALRTSNQNVLRISGCDAYKINSIKCL